MNTEHLIWQPIDTAPKKWGEMILLYGRQETHTAQDGSSSMSAGTYIYVGCWSEGFGDRWVGGIFWPTRNSKIGAHWTVLEPTHWMPLPDPPVADIEMGEQLVAATIVFNEGL